MKSGSRLERILTAGGFAVTGELGPPKSGNAEHVREKARILKGNVDAVNITDCQTAIVRMSSIAAGLITLGEGVEPVIQMTCRDRNRIGMQSDILGAAALGLKNLLCLTGDHQKFGNHPGAKGVFDMDSVQLLGMVREMRDNKRFQCGEEIKSHEPRLFIGAAANPFAGPSEQFRAQRLAKKVANGADFVQTQIIYNVERFARFMQAVRDLGLDEKVYILAGVTPPKSVGMARYMKTSVPGMDVTDEVIKRMQGAKDKEDEGINICVDIINQVREIKGVAGVHVMAIEWESAVPEIVSRAGLASRPVFEDDAPVVPVARATEVIEVRPAAGGTTEKDDELLAAARAEAEQIVAAAKEEARRLYASAPSSQAAAQTVDNETDEAGEDAMNEKERQMALESVRLGLDALKKAYGLTDDQFDALVKFAGAEAILKREPVLAVPGTVPAAKPVPAAPASPAVDPEAAKKAAEAAAAEEAGKVEAAKKAAETAAAEEAKKAAARKAAEAAAAEEAKKAEAKKAAEAAAAEEAAKKTAMAAKKAAAAAPAPAATVIEFAAEKAALAERAGKIPADSYKQAYTGAIRQAELAGAGTSGIKVGGSATMPFQLFEGEMPNKPMIAFEVLDVKPEEWPDSLARHFAGVMDNPVAWAGKCVKEYGADAICISMVSTDPNGMNRPAGEAAKAAAEVVKNIEVPVVVWGCGNGEKDTETLRELTSLIGERKVCLAPLSDSNYRAIGATAMAFRYPIVAASPIDVNLAKQLNILLENLGVSLDTVLIDPSIGALGYGIEYTYSVMERIRLAALTQKDEKLQVPFICNLGREVWKAKECRLPSDAMLGDQETRGILMEAITASCMLMAGGELMIMRHPKAVSLTKALINGLTA